MGKPMPVEMLKLRDALDKMGIDWIDASDKVVLQDCPDWVVECFDGYTCLYRTWWETVEHRYSAICGIGTYGREADLLELMVDTDEPSGWLDCSNVMEIFERTEGL